MSFNKSRDLQWLTSWVAVYAISLQTSINLQTMGWNIYWWQAHFTEKKTVVSLVANQLTHPSGPHIVGTVGLHSRAEAGNDGWDEISEDYPEHGVKFLMKCCILTK